MLSAFTAEPIVELKQRDKSKIESILAHGDNLLVGLSTGSLRIYRVNNAPEHAQAIQEDEGGSSNPKFKPTELLRELEKFSKYKVEQLAIFKEANILISLSNQYISIHDLGTYELQEQLTKTKGTTLFAATSNIVHDAATEVPTLVSRLAVAVRRRLLLWSWRDGELVGDAEEIALSNSVKSLTWASGTKIVVGLNPNYVMLDIETGEQKNIIGPGSIGGQPGSERGTGTLSYIGMGSMVPTPLATGLGPDEMLLAKDVNTHFIDRTGEPLGRRQIPWRSTPKAIGYSYPFLLALQEPNTSKGVLEVRNPNTLTLLQSIELPSAHLMQVPNPGISLAHQGKGFLVASDRVIWRMKGLHYDAQIDALVDAEQLDEAISLLEMVEETLIQDKDGRLREIKMRKAQKLFDEGKFRDALDLFGEVSAPPERVIKLYPELISGDLAMQRPESPLESASTKKARPESISSKASIERIKKQATDAASVVSGVLRGNGNDRELKAAVRELQAFLADIRRRLSRFFDADQNVKSLSELREGPQADDNKGVIDHILNLKDPDDDKLKEKLLETAKLVDTTLFRAHMFATPSLAGSLFRITNHCEAEVVMSKLEETERYSELIDFLYGKRLHREALERLQKFGRSDKTDEIDPQLHGPDRTVSYLQNLPPEMIDLILEFAQWPMEQKPEMGMEIFIADTENAESLPREKVLPFLESVDRSHALRYLEHLIDELDDTTPELHQKLATLYFEQLTEATEETQNELLSKFLTLLRQSSQYCPARMLAILPRDDSLFYEATAIVYSKMGQHRQALQIYVFKLDDTAKAEEYCNQVYLQESTAALAQRDGTDAASRRVTTAQAQTVDPTSEESTIYALLLSLYLTPPPATPPEKQALPRVTDALSLLTRHGPRLPASNTLSIIPPDLLIKELESYLRGRIRTANTAMNDARVLTNLRKVEAVRVQARLLLGIGTDGDPGAAADFGALWGDSSSGMSENVAKGRRAKVIIDEERICKVCHKRLGGSVISVFPDGTVVHLGCQGRREQEVKAAAGITEGSSIMVR